MEETDSSSLRKAGEATLGGMAGPERAGLLAATQAAPSAQEIPRNSAAVQRKLI